MSFESSSGVRRRRRRRTYAGSGWFGGAARFCQVVMQYNGKEGVHAYSSSLFIFTHSYTYHLPVLLTALILFPSYTAHTPVDTMIRPTSFLRQAERLINRNPELFGPGPLARRPVEGTIGAMPPLKGLVTCASGGLAFGLAGGFAYKLLLGDPDTRKIEEYYRENPPR